MTTSTSHNLRLKRAGVRSKVVQFRLRAGCHAGRGVHRRASSCVPCCATAATDARCAFAERQEMAKAGLTRRYLVRIGLIAGGGVGGGLLATEKGMAAGLRSPAALGKLP